MKVVITGGTKGIGRAIAARFADEGASVAVCARTENGLSETLMELNKLNPGGGHLGIKADCGREAELLSFFEKVRDSYGKIDVLVNNAGVYHESGLLAEPDGSLEETLAVNLLAAYHGARFFAPGMKEQKKGHIFNICSVASLRAVGEAGAYTVSKHALLGLSRSLGAELKPFGVRVTAIIPGSTLTASWTGTELDPANFVAPADIALAISNALRMSAASTIDELHITPTIPMKS